MENTNQLPPELQQLDMMLRMKLTQENAPEEVIQKWDEFLTVVTKWKGGQ